ncbi:hypothetical protein SSCI18S_00812 [Sphingobium scionense]
MPAASPTFAIASPASCKRVSISIGTGNVQYADASLPSGAKTVAPADYVRIETQRLATQADVIVRPEPQTARLAYLMLATLGR